MLNLFSRSKPVQRAGERLYGAVVTRSRQPVFFVSLGVADTLDGRFDLLTLHAALVLIRLTTNPDQPALAQAFIDRQFIGLEEALRDLGVGDARLTAKLKAMAAAFYGRLSAYRAALGGEGDLAAVLTRNLYRGVPTPCIAAMTAYVLGANRHLSLTQVGEVDFGPLPLGQE